MWRVCDLRRSLTFEAWRFFMLENDRYLTEREVAALTSIALPTLRNHRVNHTGIPYVKIGRSVRYSLRDVQKYMQARRVVPGGEDVA
ncbi:MAG: helix-turn-helix transcriptional regulator [Propionibacteriaceae bacterium]